VTPAKAKEGGTLIEALSARTNWPTPSAAEFRTTDKEKLLARRAQCKAKHQNGNGFGLTLGNAITLSESASGGSLNPTWVEWLMGFPLGWTALDASETPSSRKSRRSSSKRSTIEKSK
jgi:hypothetical protein